MYVCVCLALKERELSKVIDEKSPSSLEELQALTQAGTCCGNCCDELEDMLKEKGCCQAKAAQSRCA